MIDRDTIERINSAANIVDVISDFVTLRKKGVNYQACCPFHEEKTPSFVVSPAKGFFKCFGCGKGGDAITFLMEHEGINYVEALRYLAKKYGIEIREEKMTPEQAEANNDRESMMVVTAFARDYFIEKLTGSSEGRNIGLSYFYERGFTDATIEKFQLGYCPAKGDLFTLKALESGYKEDYLIRTGLTIKHDTRGYYDRFAGRVIFPIHSLSGRVIGFGGRILNSDKHKAKYLNSPESEIYHKSHTLYGISFARKEIVRQDRCILVEGYTDVISMHQSGIENIVASSGTSLTTEQIKLIKRFTNNITVIYDSDFAGIKASLRGIDMILREGMNVRVVLMPDGEDPDSFARTHSASETNGYILGHEEDFLTFKTKLLLKDTKDDPIGRASVITDVIGSIAEIPDKIIRSQYIKECSRLLDVDETLINQEVTKKQIGTSQGSEALNYYKNTVARQQQQAPPVIKISEGDDLRELEKELLTYLLRYGDRHMTYTLPRQEPVQLNVARTILDELEMDELSFTDPVYDLVYQNYKKLYAEKSAAQPEDPETVRVEPQEFINYPDPRVSEFVVTLLTEEERYRSSRIWYKFTELAPEDDDNGFQPMLDTAVPKALALYKLKIVEKMIRELTRRLEETGDLAILKQIDTLNANRKAINQKYSRLL